jgi:nitroimidazol reductase NimA-like FMN-containing flavoprotein (pyridoxamine 5'-phosphate oxidase superfamily)
MHRAEYEITAEAELLDFLLRGKFVTRAMRDKPYPYLVTLSYGLDPVARCLYLHTARVGHKLDLLSLSPSVCGTVVHDLGHQNGKCTHSYASVSVYGRLRRVDDGEERRRGMRVLLQVWHNPSYFKRVEPPYYLIVLALTDNAKFHEEEFRPVPAAESFRF